MQNKMLYLGDLQYIGKPLVSLYTNEEKNKLYLYLRINSPKDSACVYLITKVNPENVLRYMDRRITLRSLFSTDNYIHSDTNETLPELSTLQYNNQAKEVLKKAGKFDPEFCHDNIRLMIFLRKLAKNMA